MTDKKAFIVKTLDVIEDQPLTVMVDYNTEPHGVGLHYMTGEYDTPLAFEDARVELSEAHEAGQRPADFWGFFAVTKEGAGSLAVALVEAIQALEEAGG